MYVCSYVNPFNIYTYNYTMRWNSHVSNIFQIIVGRGQLVYPYHSDMTTPCMITPNSFGRVLDDDGMFPVMCTNFGAVTAFVCLKQHYIPISTNFIKFSAHICIL